MPQVLMNDLDRLIPRLTCALILAVHEQSDLVKRELPIAVLVVVPRVFLQSRSTESSRHEQNQGRTLQRPVRLKQHPIFDYILSYKRHPNITLLA